MKFLLFLLSLAVVGCTADISDKFKRVMDSLALQSQSAITLVTNTTTENPVACQMGNQIVIHRSAALGRPLYCRETANLADGLAAGEYCPGGVQISTIAASNEIKDCSQMTLCGVAPSTVQKVSQKSDGATIDELRFSNLPWGCETNLEFSVDKSFAPENVGSLKILVQPSECPFCPRQNQKTCLPCRDLASDEVIISGEVIQKCSGANCRACPVLGLSGETVPHGQGKLYYKSDSGECTQKCGDNSLLRVCNNGLWEGDPSFAKPQCFDSPCGCSLVGDPVTYAHRASKLIYKSTSPACGVKCSDQSLLVTCSDGTWQSGSPATNVPPFVLSTYPAKSCTERVCNCVRPNRTPIADGQMYTVFSKNPVTCNETCGGVSGAVQCNAGVLTASNPAFLSYAFDSCSQEDCGCRVELDGGKFVLLGNGGSIDLYKYATNSAEIPTACSNSANRITVSCTNKVLTPPYDPNVFKYKTCTEVPLGCTFTSGNGNQVKVDHLAKITVSVTSTPKCAEACQNLQITCDNQVFKKNVGGSLVAISSAELATYKEAAICTPKNCSCNVNGNILAYNTTASNFYSTDKVTNCDANGCEKSRTSITCTENGAVAANGNDVGLYKYRSCEVVLCECAAPWGGSIENGKTVRVFSTAAATCQNRNVCSDPASFKSITCNNGVLTPYSSSQYPFLSCSPPICECSFGDQKVPFGNKLTVYEYEVAPDGDLCEPHSKEITCNPGGIWTGAADLAQYPFTTCRDMNDSGVGGGTGGGGGNDEGPGFGIKKRMGLIDVDPGDGGGGPCLDAASCRSKLVYQVQPPRDKTTCILPWGGGEIEYFGSVSAFDKLCVTAPDRCSKHRIVRTCHDIGWTGTSSFKFPKCEEKAVCP